MRIPSSVFVIATIWITLGSAQSINDYLTQIPSCALTCIAAGAVASGCGSTDYNCICGTARPTVIKNITPCIASGCSVPDALTAQKNALQVCAILSSGARNSTATSSGVQGSTSLVSPASSVVLSGSATKASGSTQTTSTTSSTASATSASSGGGLVVLGSFAGVGMALLTALVS